MNKALEIKILYYKPKEESEEDPDEKMFKKLGIGKYSKSEDLENEEESITDLDECIEEFVSFFNIDSIQPYQIDNRYSLICSGGLEFITRTSYDTLKEAVNTWIDSNRKSF